MFSQKSKQQLEVMEVENIILSDTVELLTTGLRYNCSTCDIDWVQRAASCYLLSEKEKTWQESRDACAAMSDSLAPTSALGVTEWGSALTTAHTPVKLILQGKTSDIRCVLSPRLGPGIGVTPCPSSWLHYNDHCYGFFPKKMTWSAAEVQCQLHCKGAHLASVLTEVERDMVANYMAKSGSKDYVWIGLHDPNKGDQRRMGLELSPRELEDSEKEREDCERQREPEKELQKQQQHELAVVERRWHKGLPKV
ncbi:unnamed protein product, partial [Caretta caretta]